MDTGSTYTLMQNNMQDRPFVLADGKSRTALVRLVYVRHGSVRSADNYIMDDQYLAFPLILVLNLVRMGVQINVAECRYGLQV